MSNFFIDGYLLKKMIIEGANALEENKSVVDSLNVFPVPDGDTGTNMSLTILAAAREIGKATGSRVCDIAKAAASGSLRGARGNSGVIVSQLFRGFAKGLENKETASIEDIAASFVKASETAYKAVMKPKEGTILTVSRVIAEKASEISPETEDFGEFTEGIMKAGQEILLKTTQMLPQLKEAGVVDAGGKGLLIFLEAAAQGVYKTGEVSLREISAGRSPDGQAVTTADFARLATSDIKFAYCTEFFINLNAPEALEKSEHGLKLFLDNIGDSIVVVGDDDIIKVHVHTNHPGDVLEKAMTYGFLSNLKIENMKLQHTNLIEGDAFKTVAASVVSPDTAPVGSPFSSAYSDADAPVKAEPPKEAGIVAVAMGEGMAKLFKDLGADAVIEGGQTMNPSTEDFLDAIGKLTAKSIILLPNNKNVILAAQQAAKLYKEKTVYTIPSRTMPEGFAAMINYLSVLPVEEMTQNMTEAVNEVKTGQITLAVRDTVLNGKTIKQGDILCMESDDIKIVSEDMEDGAVELLEGMTTEGSEMVTIYYGADVTEDDAARIKNRLIAQKPEVEVELHNGGQPLYHYIFSVE